MFYLKHFILKYFESLTKKKTYRIFKEPDKKYNR